jgi:hypothetical protein
MTNAELLHIGSKPANCPHKPIRDPYREIAELTKGISQAADQPQYRILFIGPDLLHWFFKY